MANSSKIRILGGVGSILILLAIIPVVGSVIALVGFVLVVAAVYYFSQIIRNKKVFNNYLIAVIILIAGIAIAVTYISFAILSPNVSSVINSLTNSTATNSTTTTSTVSLSSVEILLAPIFIFLAILTASFVVSAIFLRRSFKVMAQRSGVRAFDTAGLLYLIGACLFIVFGIGAIVVFVALIFQVIAFFSLPNALGKRTSRHR